MRIGDLKPNEENPRKVSDQKLEFLKNSIAEFGDLSGFVHNRRSERIVGGHQRQKVMPPGVTIHITKLYPKPTRIGTVAVGYLLFDGERHSYRQVDWDESKEKAANIAANKGAGSWDDKLLSQWMRDLDEYGFDLDLTMFDEDERSDFLVNPSDFKPGTEADQSRLDEKKKAVCPHCGESFTVAGRT